MNPTEYFRFVETARPSRVDDGFMAKVRVLQQWWEGEKMIPGGGGGEWRDVPLLPEDNTSPHDWPE